jgi:hypothetical protein
VLIFILVEIKDYVVERHMSRPMAITQSTFFICKVFSTLREDSNEKVLHMKKTKIFKTNIKCDSSGLTCWRLIPNFELRKIRSKEETYFSYVLYEFQHNIIQSINCNLLVETRVIRARRCSMQNDNFKT